MNKTNWWKRGGSNHYRAVVFVPPTPGAQLAKLMQAKENQINFNSKNRIKIVEGRGVKLKNLLTRKNPFGTQDCEKPVCPLCKPTPHSEPGQLRKHRTPCSTQSVGYSVICLECKSKGLKTTYEGETGRSASTRTSEHINDLLKNKKDSPLVKHKNLQHNGEKGVRFAFKIEKVFRDPLTRQCNEGVRIKNAGISSKIMNSKSEINHPPTNRITIDRGRQNHVKNGVELRLTNSFHPKSSDGFKSGDPGFQNFQ